MKIKQIATLLNTWYKEVTGEENLLSEDLANIVEKGKTFTDAVGYDNFVNALPDRISRVAMVSRRYTGFAPDLRKIGDEFPYGGVTEKIRMKLPKTTVNDSYPVGETWTVGNGWSESTKPTNDNANPYITVRPELESTFFTNASTVEIDITIPDNLYKTAFNSPAELTRLVNLIETRIQHRKQMDADVITMRAINNLIATKIYEENGVVDVLASYNDTITNPLTPEQAMSDPAFIRFAIYVMKSISTEFTAMSTLYNTENYATFTPVNRQKLVVNSRFSSASEIFLQADTYHDALVKIPEMFTSVPFWQGTGTEGNTSDRLSINVKTADGHIVNSVTGQIGESSAEEDTPFYILGTLFDIEACWCEWNYERTTSQYNPRKEQTTYFHKSDVAMYNDLAENCVVFTMGRGTKFAFKNE